jgi:hypothetical protein
MSHDDWIWAQNVVERWAIRQAVPAPKVATVLTSTEELLAGYGDNTIVINENAWDKQRMDGKALLLAKAFRYYIKYDFDPDRNDEKAHKFALELALYELELWSDATGVELLRLMNIKSVSKLRSFLHT